jgi:hypothetical protein
LKVEVEVTPEPTKVTLVIADRDRITLPPEAAHTLRSWTGAF